MKRGAQGCFISFEGGEGAGKSTHLRLLADHLISLGQEVVLTREPGGTVGAEQIRTILKSGNVDKFDPLSEALLLYAARRDHVLKVLQPALAEGKWILCDRFSDSTFVYQCVAGGLPVSTFHALQTLAIRDFRPDVTLVLDLDPRVGLTRSDDGVQDTDGGGEEDTGRFERKGLPFHQTVREGYLQVVRENPDRCALIDSAAPVEDVHHRILAALRQKGILPESGETWSFSAG